MLSGSTASNTETGIVLHTLNLNAYGGGVLSQHSFWELSIFQLLIKNDVSETRIWEQVYRLGPTE
jgi:hypothetical protein